ncbi:DUF1707 and DUF4190 domain-containing protein [Streptomyces armeniacus]|uniref:DUF1707 and DUF4190 domain-containing protein n=1 Tax=Streptomyces armeniacus TaxID=83291 RepID=A0A345XKF9_9ACTN|nr:DUF1707 and DUF4190 domain-containing protein [Streptomyces armeniacus]AXK32125.1 DUF1707 and DUF4190 domain-containing protein [Streptomyces armeniacus]
MLASNSDRERAVDVLRAAFAEGRLTKEEHDQRTGRAVAARSIEELQQLTADLPHGPGGAAPTPALPAAFHGRGQYGPPMYPGPVYPPLMPARPTNSAAIGALVCGLVTPITLGISGLPAIILGHKARSEIRRTGERGDGSAVAGLALGWLALGILLLVLIAS